MTGKKKFNIKKLIQYLTTRKFSHTLCFKGVPQPTLPFYSHRLRHLLTRRPRLSLGLRLSVSWRLMLLRLRALLYNLDARNLLLRDWDWLWFGFWLWFVFFLFDGSDLKTKNKKLHNSPKRNSYRENMINHSIRSREQRYRRKCITESRLECVIL